MKDMTKFCPPSDTLAGWVEGRLSAPEQAALKLHLAGCDQCRRAVALAATLEPAAEAPLNEALLSRVVSASRRRPLWRWAAAAGVLSALAVSLWFARPRAPERVVKAPEPAGALAQRPPHQVGEPRIEVSEEPPPPSPKVAPKPEPAAPKKPEAEVAKAEEPKPVPPAEPAAPKPEPVTPPVRSAPGVTGTDLATVFASVFTVDPSGDLWIQRGEGHPSKAGAFETVNRGDMLTASAQGGAFTLEGRATVVLEKGAEASVYFFKPDKSYELSLAKGLVMVDTEGSPQNWRITRGSSTLAFSNVVGRFSVEPRGEQFSALLLEGRGELRAGAASRRAEVGREVTSDGRSGGRGETRKKGDRFAELRPKSSTVFLATFDEKETERPFAYTVPAGRPASEGSGQYLEAALPESESTSTSSPEKGTLKVAVKPEHPIGFTTGMVLRFRYRTTAPSFVLNLGEFSHVYASKSVGGRWADAEIPLAAFEREGVMMVPVVNSVPDVRFEAPWLNKNSRLDVDGVQFLRRTR